MPLLARLKSLRGTWADPFGHTEERKLERRLIGEFEAAIGTILAHLTSDSHALAVEIASAPRRIRGFGPIKLKAAAVVQAEMKAGLERLRAFPRDGKRAAE
jgi:indolepyruvate ferredoxin oxidoreductase